VSASADCVVADVGVVAAAGVSADAGDAVVGFSAGAEYAAACVGVADTDTPGPRLTHMITLREHRESETVR
jgi:hypothetical protein